MKLELDDSITKECVWSTFKWCLEDIKDYAKSYKEKAQKDPSNPFYQSMAVAFDLAGETIENRMITICKD